MKLVEGVTCATLQSNELGYGLSAEEHVINITRDCLETLLLLCVHVNHLSLFILHRILVIILTILKLFIFLLVRVHF